MYIRCINTPILAVIKCPGIKPRFVLRLRFVEIMCAAFVNDNLKMLTSQFISISSTLMKVAIFKFEHDFFINFNEF